MRIAHISDTHILSESSDKPEAGPRAEDLRRCIADINRLDPGPDLVIHTGDTVQTGAPDEYARFKGLIAPLQVPFYPTLGNRDDRNNFLASVGNGATEQAFAHYTIDDHPVRLIALDSIVTEQRKGEFCPERQRWLDDTLSAEPDRPTILFIHHPPFDLEATEYVNGYRDSTHRDALAGIVRRHGQVRHLFCGHCHRARKIDWAGTKASTMTSVARDVRKGVDEDRHGDTPIYLLHTVAEDGSVTTETRYAA